MSLKNINSTEYKLNTDPPKLPVPSINITNFNMPFWSIVRFMIKLAFASIPAMIVIFIVMSLLPSILSLMLLSQ